jgi:hypothetical protein
MTTTLPPSLNTFNSFQKENGAAAANRLLFSWLSSDTHRKQLVADLVDQSAPLFFSSNASSRDTDEANFKDFDWLDGPRNYYQKAVLLAHPKHVEAALKCSNALTRGTHQEEEHQTQEKLDFSNSPYRGLGGYFMLALDAPTEHDYQRACALEMLTSITDQQYDALATVAFKAGSMLSLRQHDFDLASMAEIIAARYVLSIFGFAQKDIGLILESTRCIGRGLQYQIMGRHFVFEPSTMIESRAGLAKLAQRAAQIIELFAKNAALTRVEQDERDEIQADIDRLGGYDFQIDDKGTLKKSLATPAFMPLLQKMASTKSYCKPKDSGGWQQEFGNVEKGLLAASLVGGSVTNIQNSICICLSEFFKQSPENLAKMRRQAIDERKKNPDAQWLPSSSKTVDWVKEALRVSPPVVFVPRRTNRAVKLDTQSTQSTVGDHSNLIPADTLVLVALAGTSSYGHDGVTDHFALSFDNPVNPIDSASKKNCPFSKTMGGAPLVELSATPALSPPRWEYNHSCPGMMMAMHVIAYTARQLLVLPSITQRINADTGKPYGLEKRWGFQCTSYPISYQKEQLLAQTPLQTILPIKSPVDFHSQELKKVIALGAPFIDKVLADSRMVHFASFVFLDNDSKLALFTMYDGDFDTYIGHFAKEFGHLFDRFFEHVTITPKMPIREHPFEFVQYLKQFVQQPVGGYYFSAYPEATTDRIVHHFKPQRQYDFNEIRGGQ